MSTAILKESLKNGVYSSCLSTIYRVGSIQFSAILNPYHAKYFIYYTPAQFYPVSPQHSRRKQVVLNKSGKGINSDRIASSEAN